jgi:predicted nucleic acid-binding protein
VKVFFDTSVLVAALVKPHPRHASAIDWLKRAIAGDIEFFASTHSLAELYSTLSAFPVRPRISPAIAWQLIQENVATTAQLVSLSSAEYSATLERVSAMGLAGGVVYDALIARAAEKADAERLLTFNDRDFRRVWPEGASILFVPP